MSLSFKIMTNDADKQDAAQKKVDAGKK